jgi:SAM-dependent methyltransferase
MARNVPHDLLPEPTHDEACRQRFVLDLKRVIARQARPLARVAYEREVKPALVAANGREPASPSELAAPMYASYRYQVFSALHRAAQEMMWDAVAAPLVRDLPRLRSLAAQLAASPARKGSLEMPAEFEPPAAMRAIHVHLQPGGYTFDAGDGDVTAGALYEAGGALYSMGQGVGVRESKAEVVQRFLADRYPGLAPRRILDLGCSAGASSTPYATAFPDAEVHAVDVGRGMLRYAHARAEALGARVHFHLADATRTPFPDGSFDLVISHNTLHEMPAPAVAAMFRESRRLLAPGGVCVHQDVPLKYADLDVYTQFDYGWDQDNNNEPFWRDYATADGRQMMVAAGFPPESVWEGRVAQLDGTIAWQVVCAQQHAP